MYLWSTKFIKNWCIYEVHNLIWSKIEWMSCYKYYKFQVNLFLFFKLTEFVVMFTETQFGVNLNSFQVNSKEFQDIFCHPN